MYRVDQKMSHSWEPKKLDTSYSETKYLLDLKLWQQRALMSTPCSQSLRPNRCVVSEYEVPNFLGSQEWDIFLGPPCIYHASLDSYHKSAIVVYRNIPRVDCCTFCPPRTVCTMVHVMGQLYSHT